MVIHHFSPDASKDTPITMLDLQGKALGMLSLCEKRACEFRNQDYWEYYGKPTQTVRNAPGANPSRSFFYNPGKFDIRLLVKNKPRAPFMLDVRMSAIKTQDFYTSTLNMAVMMPVGDLLSIQSY